MFSLVPNSPTSAIGNACANPTRGHRPQLGNGLTGIGTDSVECQASVSLGQDRHVDDQPPAPNSLTVVHGGHRASKRIFMGILLPA